MKLLIKIVLTPFVVVPVLVAGSAMFYATAKVVFMALMKAIWVKGYLDKLSAGLTILCDTLKEALAKMETQIK